MQRHYAPSLDNAHKMLMNLFAQWWLRSFFSSRPPRTCRELVCLRCTTCKSGFISVHFPDFKRKTKEVRPFISILNRVIQYYNIKGCCSSSPASSKHCDIYNVQTRPAQGLHLLSYHCAQDEDFNISVMPLVKGSRHVTTDLD